jgi:hypothetical protein
MGLLVFEVMPTTRPAVGAEVDGAVGIDEMLAGDGCYAAILTSEMETSA